jgi:hypothetical protein
MELWTNIRNNTNVDIDGDFQILEECETNEILYLKNSKEGNQMSPLLRNTLIDPFSKKGVEGAKQPWTFSNGVSPLNEKIKIDFNYYINDLLKSYDYKLENVIKQFKIDVPRMKVYYNSKKITSVDDFLQLINNDYILMLICTQACIGMVYEKLHNIFLKKRLCLSDDSNKNKLLIAVNNENILIKKKLQTFFIDENGDKVVVDYINIKLKINLENKEIFFTWRNNKKEKEIRL